MLASPPSERFLVEQRVQRQRRNDSTGNSDPHASRSEEDADQE